MYKKATITIHTCDKFSDIWDANIGLLNKNWSDRNMRTILVTDKKTTKNYDGIEILSAGENLGNDMPTRLSKSLNNIDSEYTIFLLDDYFLTKNIDNNKIKELIEIMESKKIDYLSFNSRRPKKELINKKYGIYTLDISCGDPYMLTLYQSIWRTSFFKKMIRPNIDIWNFEVSLTNSAIIHNGKCCTCMSDCFPIEDVIRKGYFIRKKRKLLTSLGFDGCGRRYMPLFMSIRIAVATFVSSKFPRPLYKLIKKILKKLGYKIYS